MAAMGALLSTASVLAQDSVIKQFELDLNGNPVVISTIYFNGPGDGSESSGQNTSNKSLVNENSPYYELWTKGMANDSGTWYLLDTAMAGPTTYLTLVSGDYHEAGEVGGTPYRPFTPIRTRADQSYGIILQSHLTAKPVLEDGEVEEPGHVDTENVYYRSTTLTYSEETNTGDDNSEIFTAGTSTEKIFNISGLSTTSASDYELYRDTGTSKLPIEDTINFKQRGQDIYRVYALTNAGVAIAPLVQAKMQIWPIAQGGIELIGYKPYDTITRSLPDIKITLKDLYPYSTTYALIYKGTKAVPLLDGFPARVIEISRRSVPMDNLVPQSQEYTISADDWKSYVPDDCEYTIEIVTHTPFEGLDYPATNPEVAVTLADNGGAQILPIVDGRTSALILDLDKLPTSGGVSLFYTSFTVDRTITVKAEVITSE